jgi:hypothetical protein
MFSRAGFDVKTNQRRLPGTEEIIDALVTIAKDDPYKALVLRYIGQLVADGFAVWEMFDGTEIEVRLTSGENYLLGETTILRLT